ncbi:proA, partial [Symbiodinium necroappetens]
AGNAAILRGGSESFHSSGAILDALHKGLAAVGLPETCLQRPPVTDRAAVGHLLRMHEHLDLIIPRGGRGLIERVMQEASVPVLAHLDGNCHTYLHAAADPEMAKAIAVNAKMRRTAICGATETLLVDRSVAETLLPPILEDLLQRGCELRGDAVVQRLTRAVAAASEADWDTEFLGPVLAIKTVAGLEEAIDHIARHGSHHTDAIVTDDAAAAETFLNRVDSAIVMHNASTQYADGGEFGMGAEIGISTGRLHARGPVGANELTIYKYRVRGQGQVCLQALKRLGLDEVWWLVSPQNPLKPVAGMGRLADRLARARAVAAHPRLRVTALERRLPTALTAETLRALRHWFAGVHFVWLMGADNLGQIHRWTAWQEIFHTVGVAVLDRPSYSFTPVAGKAARRFARARIPERKAGRLASAPPPAWTFLHIPRSALSATALRARAPSGLPDAVAVRVEAILDRSATQSVTDGPAAGAAEDIVVIDLAGRSSIADYMVIASGRSSRQVVSLAEKLQQRLKAAGYGPVAMEGQRSGDWVVVDALDVVVHLFRPEVREFYNLEKMWMTPPAGEERGARAVNA